jgi:hypothetical protein
MRFPLRRILFGSPLATHQVHHQKLPKFIALPVLLIPESPYWALIEPIVRYVDEDEREWEDDVITVIIPEFVPEKWWASLLHGQSGMMLKWALLFKKGVVVTNVRYHLSRAPERGDHLLVSGREKVSA